MEFALSQEGDIVKLFVSKVNWTKLYPLLENETVTVKLFGVWIEVSVFMENLSASSCTLYKTVRLRNKTLPINSIPSTLAEKNPLKKYKSLDKEEILKFHTNQSKLFKWKQVKDSYSAEEIWAHVVEAYANDCMGVVEVDLSTEDFQLKYEESANGFCFTFRKRTKLISICDSIKELFSASEWSALQDAIKWKQSYATKLFQSDFKAAGNVNRMVYFIRKLKKSGFLSK